MSYAHPSIENDIRARALALADALAATHPASTHHQKVRDEFGRAAAAARLPSDQMTWFAIERVAGRLNLACVRLEFPGTPIPAGAIVLVDPAMPTPQSPSDDTMRALRAASFVVAPEGWGPVLRAANLAGFCVDDPQPASAAQRMAELGGAAPDMPGISRRPSP